MFRYCCIKGSFKREYKCYFVKNYKKPYSWIKEINRISLSNDKQFIISKNNYKLGQPFIKQ